MTAEPVPASGTALLLARLDRAALFLAFALVATLPYSVSVTSVLVPVWIAVLVPTLSRSEILSELREARSYLPVALALLLVLGLLWGEGSGRERFAAVGALMKLCVLPLLFVQFRRAGEGRRIAVVYVAALVPILVLSFATLVWPQGIVSFSTRPDVPFKDYIAQSAFFAFAAFMLAHEAADAWRDGRRLRALAAALLALAFVANIGFVITARTTLVVVPLLAMIFVVQRAGARAGLALVLVGVVLAGLMWAGSPRLRERALAVGTEIGEWQRTGAPTSSGLRAEWWLRSLTFMREAPVVGHGTGSIASLFRRAANPGYLADQPHNQVLTVGLQVGLVGIALLLAMWTVHAGFFLRAGGLAGMIGFAVVAQNVVSSLFNSHLTDFTQGWAYVLGVGICGGLALGRLDRAA